MTPGNRPSWTYRALMRLFPRAFRAEYGDDMCRLFLERREEAGTSRLARARVWLSGARDLIAHALAERWQGNVSWPKTSLFERRLADLRTALRGLRGAPGFAAAGIGTLALGIGANVAIFTAINSLLLQPLPLQEPERHGLWAEVFGADPDVIGRRIRLAAGAYQTRRVVGVMPESFRPLDPSYRLWSPLERDPSLSMRDDSSWFVNTVVGRLAAGSTIEQASSQVRAVAQTLHEEWPEQFTDGEARGAEVVSLRAHMARDVSATLWMLLGAVGVVLLIACVNVANLTLVRGTSRHRDLAMRAALGATRGRLLAQLLTESAVLGLAGGLGGLLVAWLSLRLLIADAPDAFRQAGEISIDPMVMGFALGISMAAVLLFGLLPARRASSAAARGGVTGSGRGLAGIRAGRRLSSALVVAEVALSIILVVGAGLMLRSLWRLYSDDLGLDPRGLLTLQVSIPEGRFEREALSVHYRRIWDSVEGVPGVEQAGGIHLLPLTMNNWNFPYEAEDHPVPEGTPRPNANHRVVTPTYFNTLGVPLLRGRGFDERDTSAAPAVGMINRRMAEDLWPDDDPLGRTLTVFGSPFTIVGVVDDVRQHGLHREIQPEMYRPFEQWPTGGMFVVIRTSGDPLSLAPSVRQAIWQIDPEAPIAQVRTMDEVFGESIASDRFVTTLLTGFGLLALVLGSIGVYGVTAHVMAQRFPEFGVRVAIGASRSAVLRQAIGSGIAPALLGVVIGLGGAWLASGLLGNLLYGIGPSDVTAFIAAPIVLVAVAGVACWVPAWRASRLDPVVVLGQD